MEYGLPEAYTLPGWLPMEQSACRGLWSPTDTIKTVSDVIAPLLRLRQVKC